jgi:hypothetical protein
LRIQTFLQGLTPTESTGYSLWKATKKIKQIKKPPPLRTSQGTWARIFQPHPSGNEPEAEALTQLLKTPTKKGHQSSVSKEPKFKKRSTT